MPPKRATARHTGSVAVSSANRTGSLEMYPGLQQAHQGGILAPRGYTHASDEHQINPRSQRQPASITASPSRRDSMDFSRPPLRQTTPDQQQLLDGLRGVTESSSPGEDTSLDPEPGPSTATPTPPIQQSLSTTSISAMSSPSHPNSINDNNSKDRKKPSNVFAARPRLSLFEPESSRGTRNSPQHTNISFDNESTISWGIERNLHGDNLHRTRPNRYRQEPFGGNISAPPRRLSGLAFPQENLEQTPQDLITTDTAPPHKTTSDSTARDPTTTTFKHSSNFAVISKTPSAPLSTLNHSKFFWVLVVTLTAFVAFGAYHFNDQLRTLAASISVPLLVNNRPIQTSLSTTHVETIHHLSIEVEKLSAQISSMAQEVSLIHKLEWSKPIPQATLAAAAAEPQVTHRVNFLSLGMGPVIDPFLTTPSLGHKHTFLRRIQSYITGSQLMVPKPPIAALTPWDGVGDCWRSTQRDGMTQMAIQLGRPMVPEEIVIEHIPKGATLEPGSAPREMELWAQFTSIQDSVVHPSPQPSLNQASPSRFQLSFLTHFFSSPNPSLAGPTPLSTLASSAAPTPHPILSSSLNTILEALRVAYRNEPEIAYSNDALLGPSFFRIGRWQYNIDSESNIQHFSLDGIIDLPTLRVEKVVIRVKSTWGAPHTCLYRLKLYGHV